MPRNTAKAPAAAEAPPSAEQQGAKEPAKGANKAVAMGVSRSPLKKRTASKEAAQLVATAPSGEGGLNVRELEKRRKELTDQLRKCELQIHRLETQYFETANTQGNALKGYDGLMSSTAVSAKKAQFRPEDRIFSGSSTSGAVA